MEWLRYYPDKKQMSRGRSAVFFYLFFKGPRRQHAIGLSLARRGIVRESGLDMRKFILYFDNLSFYPLTFHQLFPESFEYLGNGCSGD